jgi:tetratricopeptide (TPR) repeat protein
MLNFDHIRIGCSIELPELATHISNESSAFVVKGIFAGGMGVCIHFLHPETTQEFALKGIRPDFVGEQATTDRFLDELKVWIAASSCDLIAEALAVVRLNELPCVLAKWMPNGDLAHSLPRLTKTKKIEALLRIVRGLSWVNSNLGVIHRDLKPSNILLDAHGLAYVADWGLARPIGGALQSVGKAMINAVNRPDRTQQGSFLGTVTYAAPEQIMGSAAIDHRADIYALGCMMFEFETGAPPFLGKTVHDIANQHLRVKPKKLGGWFSSTNLGLERLIARCLEKNPKDRYQNYEQLESDLLPIAQAHGVVLKHCEPGTRYKRTVLGKGEKQQMDILMNVPNESRGEDGYMVVEMDDLLPFLKEANDLMALGRYAEAEKIYRPHVLPEMLGKWTQWWGLPHDMAVNYGLCLGRLGRALEAEKLFLVLAKNDLKPAVFYVNFSMALNLLNKNRQAADLCREGLKHFPNDIDIQGNLTIALSQAGEYERAFDSALKRLNIRRDVHSLDEAAMVLLEYATAIRYTDLPRAIELAKTMGDLIKEGLHLNPNYHMLRIREVLLRRLIQDAEAVNTIAPALWGSESVPLDIRKYALIQMLEHWADNGWGSDAGADGVLQFIKNHPGWISVIPKLEEIELRTIARYKMMREKSKIGERVVIPEIADYFLKKQSSGLFPDPILAAQLKDWLGDNKEALDVLATYLAAVPDDFNGIRLMATLHCSSGNFVDAVQSAQSLVKLAPWRAESYDCLAFVAGKAGDLNLEKQAKANGDRVFAEETRLCEEAKTYLK